MENNPNLTEFLAKPRTVAEIAKELKLDLNLNKIRSLSLPQDYALFEQKDERGISVFVCSKQPQMPVAKQRAWSIWREPKGLPYIWIQFSPSSSLTKLRIIPISDVHYGLRSHSRERFRAYLKWIEAENDVFVFLNGDIIENAIDGSIGGAVYESVLTPDEQIWGNGDGREPGMIELLRPIAHKILWAQPGNHEWRTWKKAEIDPLKIICGELGIPYYNEPIYADVLAWGHRYTFYCHHGKSGAATKGGKLNAAGRPGEFQEAVDFIIMGHVHDSMQNLTTRIVRKRDFDDKGKLIGFQLVKRAQYTVICPSFSGYFNSYGSRAGYSPGSWGAISCALYPDGSYRSSE